MLSKKLQNSSFRKKNLPEVFFHEKIREIQSANQILAISSGKTSDFKIDYPY
jgi:hypothetical protein